eukprot:Nitzschia sp. Nitz4//scaffold173_size47512//31936//34068//NITZ4_007163-RA/size47512-processed-gene-0.38-mRNA-1//-1//CDS//3329538817//8199//frame0
MSKEQNQKPQDSKKYKRNYGPDWKTQPSFLDSTVSVAAATFGARRVPELKTLYHQTVVKSNAKVDVTAALLSGGGKTSSRHLRRRTTAVKKRKHHRYPQGNGTKEQAIDPENKDPTPENETRKTQRGKRATLNQGHYTWKQTKAAIDARAGDEVAMETDKDATTSDRMQWMETHVWHAKRFHMASLWGWRVPLAHSNRGARAVLRLAKESYCTIQDLTWERGHALVLSIPSSAENLSKPLEVLSRLCPNIATVSTVPRQGHVVVEGLLFALDQFPMGLIGPSWWQVSEMNDTEELYRVRIMVHPAIRSTVQLAIQSLIDANSALLQWATYADQQCCIRICGANASKCLEEALQISSVPSAAQSSSTPPWQEIIQSVETVPHATCVPVAVARPSKPGQPTVSEATLLVRQCPRPLDCSSNHAVAGWDLYCSPGFAQYVWMALAMHGSCVSIGLGERSHLDMECEPPLPVFPRDEIDSVSSREYWLGESADWTRVRQVIEGGWGRISMSVQPKVSRINWGPILLETLDDDDDDIDTKSNEHLVIVRESFGEPFRAALRGCGNLPESGSGKSSRRKRRRTDPRNTVKHALPLDVETCEAWSGMIQTLLTSLSLPAVLRAHVRVIAHGTLDVGSKIFLGGMLVGAVTSAGFSPMRGSSHGMALVGASRILQALLHSARGVGRVVHLANGQKEIQVLVSSTESNDSIMATLALIL